jgi:ech hydrogenase subunit A
LDLILLLIIFPFITALVLYAVKSNEIRKAIIYLCGAVIMIIAIIFSVQTFVAGHTMMFVEEAHAVDTIMLLGEFALMVLVIFMSFRYKRYFAAFLSIIQTAVIAVVDLTGAKFGAYHLLSDGLTAVMVLIIGIVGVLICVYGNGYMTDYHHHHTDVKDRRPFFFAVLFMFLGAMFGLVLSNNLVWLYFFWEITSVASFLLISYTKTEEAITNAFRALWMNLLGGVGFAAGIAYAVFAMGIDSLDALVGAGSAGVVLPSWRACW